MKLGRPAQVLLVEDSPFLRYAARAVLQRRGYDVLEAADGQEALDLLARTRPDVILLDLVMPRVSGEEVLRALKNNPELARVPVVMLSPEPDSETGTALAGQVEGWFDKARMSLVHLADRVEAVLNDRRVA
ncbi:MAG TPA: response regulator [Gemmatimonadales bacterium]